VQKSLTGMHEAGNKGFPNDFDIKELRDILTVKI